MTSKTKQIDPLSVRCKKCNEHKWRMCIRLTGYGVGNTLRRVHNERKEDAIAAHLEKTRKARERAN